MTCLACRFLFETSQLIYGRIVSALHSRGEISMRSIGCLITLLPLLCVLSSAINLMMGAIFNEANMRLLAFILRPHRGLVVVQLGSKCLDLSGLMVTLVLQAITLLQKVSAKSVTILQLAIQGGTDVLGEIPSRLSLSDAGFGGSEAGFPRSKFLSELGTGSS